MNRVVICARGYPPDITGGGEISTELIARGLLQLGVDVHVVTFTDQASHTDHVHGVPVHRLKCPNLYWSIQASEQPKWKKMIWHGSQALRPRPPRVIRNLITELQPSILHTSTIEDLGVSLWHWAKGRGLVTVHSLRSYNLLHHQGTLYDAKRDAEISVDRLSLPKKFYAKSLDGVIGVSQCILNKHLKNGFFPKCKTTVIGNPVETCDDPVSRRAARPNQEESTPIRLGILGRVSPEKGIESFLDCLKQVQGAPPWQLEIAGTGPDQYLSQLQQTASNLPVRWVGWRPSSEFLSSLDLLVVPSRWHEPFGRIVVEAYAMGVPVLCLRRGAMPELVQHGQSGWILEEWDKTLVSQSIARCRDVNRQEIRGLATPFSIIEIARRHLEFYQTLGNNLV